MLDNVEGQRPGSVPSMPTDHCLWPAEDLQQDPLAQQRRDWMLGKQTLVSDRLSQAPALAADAGLAAELIYHEFLLRGESGETPEWDDYLQRFPQYAAMLTQLREADRIVEQAVCAQRRTKAMPAPFDDYEILEELGRGGMGIVYKARQKSLGRFVALKMIGRGETASPRERRRFESEARAVAKLAHPNIVQIYEVGETGGRPFFSQEFVQGQSLADRLGGTPLAARQAALLVEVLARAMHYAHEQGVIHRDLKPSNVLVAGTLEQGVVKVTDFGLAKSLDHGTETQTDAVLGTPSYMAPEQIAAKTSATDRRIDVYGLGAILYESITGRPPFRAESPLATLNQVAQAEPVRPRLLNPAVPRDLETICLKCLHKEPAHRYPTAADLAEDLRRFLAGQPVRARRVGPVGRTWRWSRRNPVLAGLAVVLVITLTGGLTAIVYQWRQAETARRIAVASDEEAQGILAELVETGPPGQLAHAPSLDSLRKAEAHCKSLLDRNPDSVAVRVALSNVYNHELGLYLSEGNLEKSADVTGDLKSLWESFNGPPTTTAVQHRWLAQASAFQAQVASARFDLAGALRCYLEAVPHWAEAVEHEPQNVELIGGSISLDNRAKELVSILEAAASLPLLKDARARLADKIRAAPDQTGLQQQFAAACFWFGDACAHEKSNQRAGEYWREAHKHYRAIAGARPDDLATKFFLASCCLRLVHGEASDPYYDEAVSLFEEFGTRFDSLAGYDWREWGDILLQCYCDLVICHSKAGRTDLARRTYEDHVMTFARQRGDRRIEPRVVLKHAGLLNYAAMQLREGKQPAIALPMARLAASLTSRYSVSAALDPEFLRALGNAANGTAIQLTALGDSSVALEQARLARQALEEYCRTVPNAFEAEQDLADIYGRNAKALWASGQHEGALVAFRESTELQKRIFERLPSTANRVLLGKSYDRLYYFASLGGDFHTAAASLADREKLWSGDSKKLTGVANDFQALANRLGGRKSLSPQEKADRDRYLTESRRTRRLANNARPPRAAAPLEAPAAPR
jgi:tetratricopeptide (TPR) repeat protein/predicted Ser/Thr protein kinase